MYLQSLTVHTTSILTIYFVITNFFKINRNIAARHISTYHALFAFINSCVFIYTGNEKLFDYNLSVTIIYSIFDMFLITMNGNNLMKNKYTTYFHHSIMIIVVVFCHNYRKYVAYAFLGEISNIPLNYGWLLLKYGLGNTINFKISAIVTIFLYTFFRVINFTLIIMAIPNENPHLIIIICAIGITVLNYYWYCLLLYKLYLLYKKNVSPLKDE